LPLTAPTHEHEAWERFHAGEAQSEVIVEHPEDEVEGEKGECAVWYIDQHTSEGRREDGEKLERVRRESQGRER
jgi:hypothetical protein